MKNDFLNDYLWQKLIELKDAHGLDVHLLYTFGRWEVELFRHPTLTFSHTSPYLGVALSKVIGQTVEHFTKVPS